MILETPEKTTRLMDDWPEGYSRDHLDHYKDVGLECPQQGDYEEGDSLD